jgi:hypothetical protein
MSETGPQSGNQLQLSITRHEGELFFIWSRPGHWEEEYRVSCSHIEVASQNVRSVLDRLNTFAQQNEKFDPAWQAGAEYGRILRQLKNSGRDLYLRLFNGRKKGSVEDWIAERLSQLEGGPFLIKCHKSVPVPWGFVSETDASDGFLIERRLSDFAGFWLGQYQISIQVRGSTLSTGRSEDFNVLYALHRNEFMTIAPDLAEDKAHWEKLLKLNIGPVYEWEQAGKKWAEISNADGLFFVFCHKNEHGLFLGDENDPDRHISFDRFEDKFCRDGNGSVLLFLNGCATLGDPGSFLPAVGRHGFCGLIGAESEISNDFALKYSARFIKKFLSEGATVGDAFRAMQLDNGLFPRNLLYSCYAYPHFRPSKPLKGA